MSDLEVVAAGGDGGGGGGGGGSRGTRATVDLTGEVEGCVGLHAIA